MSRKDTSYGPCSLNQHRIFTLLILVAGLSRPAHSDTVKEYLRMNGRVIAMDHRSEAAPGIDPSTVTIAGRTPATTTFTMTAPSGVIWTATLDPTTSSWLQFQTGGNTYSGSGSQTLTLALIQQNPSSSANRTGSLTVTGASFAALTLTIVQLPAEVVLGFYTVAPCRIVDTRLGQGKTGAFGPPSLAANTLRNIPVLSSSCAAGIPSGVRAFSLNMTVVPPGPMSYLTVWPGPASQPIPSVSTLNSPGGTVLANAAIAGAGSDAARSVNLFVGDTTDVLMDINGYFAPSAAGELAYYPTTPCRAVDTRLGQGKTGPFGPPSFSAYASRDIPLRSSSCVVATNAQAYSLNVTVVPAGPLDFLSLWPTGQSYPGVSTLNSPDGSVIANAAIVPAGTNGAVSFVTGNLADVIVDINGYFAPPGGFGGLRFYPLAPCRIADTRPDQGKTGAFGPPALAAYASRDIPVRSSSCGVPANAQAYSLNATAIPSGPLDFITVWPAGQGFPGISTLNSPSGRVIANAAIVTAGANGAVTVVSGNPTNLILDINGYFAP